MALLWIRTFQAGFKEEENSKEENFKEEEEISCYSYNIKGFKLLFP